MVSSLHKTNKKPDKTEGKKPYLNCGVLVLQKTVTKDGKRYNCGIMKDKDGFYATTHRARSKSYPTKKDIPHSVLKFIEYSGT